VKGFGKFLILFKLVYLRSNDHMAALNFESNYKKFSVISTNRSLSVMKIVSFNN
jgi:hypothetical protein